MAPAHAASSAARARDTYLLVKGGGLYAADGDGTDGMYLGLEVGGDVERVFDLGLCVDYFHERARDLAVLFDSNDGFGWQAAAGVQVAMSPASGSLGSSIPAG